MLCAWRAEWTDLALAVNDLSMAQWVAVNGSLDTAAIDRLARTGHPRVIANLLGRPESTEAQRTRWLSERPPGKWFRSELRARLLERLSGWRIGDLLACTDSDDQLRRHIGDRVNLGLDSATGLIPQLRMFLDLWEQRGAEAVRALLPFRPLTNDNHAEARAALQSLLDQDDPDAALDALRAVVADGERPEWQVAAWRTRRDRAALSSESHRWHWSALLAAHRREPFHHDAVGVLARILGCPEELRAEARTVLLSWQHKAYGALMSGRPVPRVLAGNDAAAEDRDCRSWLRRVIMTGHVTWAEALEHARPARAVLMHVADEARDDGLCAGPGHTELAALMRGTLKDRPDAWILAGRMLSDFTGSVGELLRTASLAAG